MSAGGIDALNEMLSVLRGMADTREVERIAAERAVRGIDAALKKTLAAGTTPDGKPWLPRKKDGGRAYKGAAGKLVVKASSNLVIATIDGGEAFGNYGAGVPERRMLPDAGAKIPDGVSEAIDKAGDETFSQIVGRK